MINFRAFKPKRDKIEGEIFLSVSIANDLLVRADLAEHTVNNLIGGDEETLTYYIHDVYGYVTPLGGGYANTLIHNNTEESYIESVFNLIDSKIDLDFQRMYHYYGSDIDIYSVSSHSNWDHLVVGTAWAMTADRYYWWDVAWTDSGNWNFDKNTIIHEIGHTLGLGHPGGEGHNPDYNSQDTVMSYNEGINGWSHIWTDLDIEALVSIWGVENDSHGENDLRVGSDSNDVIFAGVGNDTIYGYEGLDTLIGGSGSDYVYGGDGNDSIRGGSGSDYLNGGRWSYSDRIVAGEGDDFLGGGGGPDFLFGNNGIDEIRAGHGKDYLDGGDGADILYGGGGGNTFASELDKSIDKLYVMSDFRGHAYSWGRNHGGINADVITELDVDDRITILGTSDSDLSFKAVAGGTFNQSTDGIGIFDGDSLEAIYIGANLSVHQIDGITDADPSRFW